MNERPPEFDEPDIDERPEGLPDIEPDDPEKVPPDHGDKGSP